MTEILRYPTANTARSGQTGFTNPNNMGADDGTNATGAPASSSVISSFLHTFDFSSVPSDAILNSITLEGESLWSGGPTAAPGTYTQGAVAASTGAAVTPTLPTHTTNDFLGVIHFWNGSSNHPAIPANWNELIIRNGSTGNGARLLWRFAPGAATAGPSCASGTGSGGNYAYGFKITGVDQLAPFLSSTPQLDGSGNAAITMPGLTTDLVNTFIMGIAIGHNDISGVTTPAGYTAQTLISSTTGSDAAGVAFTKTQAARATAEANISTTPTWGTGTSPAREGIMLQFRAPHNYLTYKVYSDHSAGAATTQHGSTRTDRDDNTTVKAWTSGISPLMSTSQLKASGLAVLVDANRPTGGPASTASLDYIRLRVDYSIPLPPAYQQKSFRFRTDDSKTLNASFDS